MRAALVRGGAAPKCVKNQAYGDASGGAGRLPARTPRRASPPRGSCAVRRRTGAIGAPDR
ncbi:hypothetical protein CO709_22645 [Burkholderia thailandensis]|nr:hypothetical protein CO709_22645 [Burkholderia thailandensis]